MKFIYYVQFYIDVLISNSISILSKRAKNVILSLTALSIVLFKLQRDNVERKVINPTA